jgi:hypothetical protein
MEQAHNAVKSGMDWTWQIPFSQAAHKERVWKGIKT